MSHLGHLEGEQPYLGDLLTMVINHLLTGMILQVTVEIVNVKKWVPFMNRLSWVIYPPWN